MTSRTEFEEVAEHSQPGLAAQFLLFIAENKKWWLLPLVLALAGFGVLAVLSGTGAAPFIYTMF